MKEKIKEMQGRLEVLRGALDLDSKERHLGELESMSALPDFWNDKNRAAVLLKEITGLKSVLWTWRQCVQGAQEALEFLALAQQENDSDSIKAVERDVEKLESGIRTLEMRKMMDGVDDERDSIFTIHSGAGGTESQDWASMLLRMYNRWFERRKFECELLDMLPGEGAGIKSATLEVKAPYAFGYLKAEIGVHRLVRISPFDANSRRHTSFASVYAYPVAEDIPELNIEEADIRVDTFRSGGAGGQHVNKTDSAVRMTHLPTGIVVQCQSQRSQIQNRETCIKILKARVYQLFKEEKEKARDAKLAEKKKIEWGSQIRSYVMHPYKMVKDLRTQMETSDVQSVMDGELDPFVEAFLLRREI